jgi:hypothetical protein
MVAKLLTEKCYLAFGKEKRANSRSIGQTGCEKGKSSPSM